MSLRIPWSRCAHRGGAGAGGLWSRPSSAMQLTALGSTALAAGRWRQAHGSSRINPPATTRPPPLTLPSRDSVDSTMQYLFQLGKGYLKFYKDGVKNIFANRKLLREKINRVPIDDRPSVFVRPHHVPATFSRADWVLLWRVRHDMARLPLFGLMLIVIGEFTALVVIYVDKIIPYTCRIPKQLFTAAERAERRRRSAFEELERQYPRGIKDDDLTEEVFRKHVLQSLDLSGAMWDRLGWVPPGMWLFKGKPRMAFLEGDDRRLVEDGGPLGLEAAELTIACRERGIDTLGKSESELRDKLSHWLRLTAAEEREERRLRMARLLLTRPEKWPRQRDFALPDWEL